MCSTHDVFCFICNKQLAWWSMFDNIQYADEYTCQAAIIEATNKPLMKDVPQDDEHLKKLQKVIDKKKKWIVDETERRDFWTYCRIKNKTYFCESCAKKLKLKCPECGGKIKLDRKR